MIETFPATQTISIHHFQDNTLSIQEDELANEVRIALIYNGVSHTVMMATPQNLEMFAIGFTLSERIVEQAQEIKSVDIEVIATGVMIFIEITQRRFMALKEQKRSMAGRTGCGLCGIAQLEHAVKPIIKLPHSRSFNLQYLSNALHGIKKKQTIFSLTGATHAAMGLSASGNIEFIFEDVGRHIALDKLIGASIQHKQLPQAVLLTSRASFEMVQKAVSVGIEILFAISAATALAIELAKESNLTLVGFCRNGKATIYTHPERLNY